MMNISQKVTIQFSLVAASFLKKYTQKQENFHVFKVKRYCLKDEVLDVLGFVFFCTKKTIRGFRPRGFKRHE